MASETLPEVVAGTHGAHRLTGSLLMRATGCWYPPAVESNDILDVDFDRHDVDSDGLYLLEEMGVRGVEWRGCRRFALSPLGVRMDHTGEGDWRDIDLGRSRFRVVGKVIAVYKASSASHDLDHAGILGFNACDLIRFRNAEAHHG